ncbi:hypothetical protein A3K93_06945 [Acinetobacter sp. NCu2D-2]|uniref:hypothetical protein n=1 Tax=Acinetobacter sp. NCu2D-2 TaxID=1608473 RepID=UPI0007CDE919|nr:hypothetical protein [Acinetobacter sp. NCu2D-2]ANF81954.1 hypothetical protein A3K93_06945 [Acinetobacter sp. NCu2D-2]
MLVKIEDGFYLNSQHIISVQVSRNVSSGLFEMKLQYTPSSIQTNAEYIKVFDSQIDAEIFLNDLNQKIR